MSKVTLTDIPEQYVELLTRIANAIRNTHSDKKITSKAPRCRYCDDHPIMNDVGYGAYECPECGYEIQRRTNNEQ